MRRTYWMSVEQICTIIAALMLASCVRVHAQFGVEQPMFAAWSTTTPIIDNPTNIANTMFRWWVSLDAAVGVTLSNQIVDRIVGDHLWQMNVASSPTNAANGIYFSGSTFLTNGAGSVGYDVGAIVGPDAVDTFYFAFVPSGSAGEQQMFSYGTVNNRGPGMNGNNLRYTGLISGGPNTICSFAANTTNDVVIVLRTNITEWYTNGVPLVTNATTSVDDFGYWRMGSGGLGAYNGYILENGIYTNSGLSPTQIGKLHKYLTNAYKYTP